MLEDPGGDRQSVGLGNPVAVAAGGDCRRRRGRRRSYRRARAVRRILFDDGSVCKCGAMCEEQTNCCEDWIELCPGEPPLAGAQHIRRRSTAAGGRRRVSPCPAALDLASSAERHVNHAAFLNHARHPLRLFLVGGSLAELVLLGTLGANGQTLRVAAADSFAWTLKTYSGVTVHQWPRSVARRRAPSTSARARERGGGRCGYTPDGEPIFLGKNCYESQSAAPALRRS